MVRSRWYRTPSTRCPADCRRGVVVRLARCQCAGVCGFLDCHRSRNQQGLLDIQTKSDPGHHCGANYRVTYNRVPSPGRCPLVVRPAFGGRAQVSAGRYHQVEGTAVVRGRIPGAVSMTETEERTNPDAAEPRASAPEVGAGYQSGPGARHGGRCRFCPERFQLRRTTAALLTSKWLRRQALWRAQPTRWGSSNPQALVRGQGAERSGGVDPGGDRTPCQDRWSQSRSGRDPRGKGHGGQERQTGGARTEALPRLHHGGGGLQRPDSLSFSRDLRCR